MCKSRSPLFQGHVVSTSTSIFGIVCFIQLALAGNVLAQDELIAGQNINMVSGTTWPGGDPFLNKQNEGTLAVSARNDCHLMGGSNDYRSVDLPGLADGKTVGDSWVSTYVSLDCAGSWFSTLLPGYPQDVSPLGLASPLRGYDASADPVIRSAASGLFHYSGIAFTRGFAAPSAGFVSTFIDLNNTETGNPFGYVGTAIFDQDNDGLSFIDKPWTAVDKPRGRPVQYIDVHTDDDGMADHTNIPVECGNVYTAYARIQGDGSAAIRSQIMFTRSEDCGQTFSVPTQISLPNTINQGASVAVNPLDGRIQVAWRQFENATLNCTRKEEFWRNNPEAWPIQEVSIAGDTYNAGESRSLFPKKSHGERPWQVLRQLLGAWLNALSGAARSDDVIRSMAATESWLLDFPPGTNTTRDESRLIDADWKTLRNYNQGKLGQLLCDDLLADDTNGLLSGLNPNAIMVVNSTDFGATFSDPVAVTGPEYHPFEQATTEFSFRTLSFPTMAFDHEGRSYIAVSSRGFASADPDPVGGDARIAVTTSLNGATWTALRAIDDEFGVPNHQIMPAFDFHRGKLFLLYYDFRQDSLGFFDRFIVDVPLSDTSVLRHTTDVRAAIADPADNPVFTDYSVLDGASTQASRYPFLILHDDGTTFRQQLKINSPGLPVAKDGSAPFFSDYVDLASQDFYYDDNTFSWEFDILAGRGAPLVHAVWTDNRDVVPPIDGDWKSFVPPTYNPEGLPPSEEPRFSIFDPSQTVAKCTPATIDIDRTRMRNQNIYTSRLTQGLVASIPGNNRALGTIQRAFVGFVQNTTRENKLFRLRILNQPPNGSASFDQFSPEAERIESINANSSIARTVFVTSIPTDPSVSVDIEVQEVVELEGGGYADGELGAVMTINPDPSAPAPDGDNLLTEEVYTPAILNPAIFNPTIFSTALLGDDESVGIYNPAILNPTITNVTAAMLMQLALLNPAILNPAILNPAILNPAILNPAILNPAILNPAILNPAILNPAILNPAILNPAILNPAILNPAILNPAILNPAIPNSTIVETSVIVENTGNATAAYSLNLDLDSPPDGLLYQVMVYRTYSVPSADGCTLTEEVVQELLVTDFSPNLNGDLNSPDSTSFYVEPGDHVVVSFRILRDPDPLTVPGNPAAINTLDTLKLSQSIVPQAVDTAGIAAGQTEPTPVVVLSPSVVPLTIDTTILPDGQVGTIYSASLSASGGDGSAITWFLAPGSALPPGLVVDSNNRAITGIPTTDGTYDFVLRAQDDNLIAERALSITISFILVDQSQPVIDTLAGNLTIDGDPVSGQKVAQVVAPLITTMGMLTNIRLPVWCATGDLVIEMQAVGLSPFLVPDGTVLSTQVVPNASIPNGPTNALNNIALANPQPVLQTERFAIVLSSANGTCAIQQGPLGDPYAFGSSYFDQAPFNPADWTLHVPRDDFPFETIVAPTNLRWRQNNNSTDGVFAWSRTFGRGTTDNHSVRIQASSRSVPLSNPGWATLDRIPVDPTATYEASVWTYTPDGGVGHIPMIQMYRADGTFLGAIGATGPSRLSDPTGVWLQKSFTFRLADLPCCAAVASVRFIVQQDIEDFFATGTVTTVFFDDVVLRTTVPVLGPNLLPRPSFGF